MINYKQLKHNDNGIPTWDAFLGPLLYVANTKVQCNRRQLVNETLKEIKLPEELLEMVYPSKYHDRIAYNHANWAISDLKISGLLHSPKRGEYEITELGKSILKQYGTNITRSLVHSQPAYLEHKKNLKNRNTTDNDSDIQDEQALDLTENQIQNWFDKQNDDLTDALLEKLRKTDSYQFEHMMIHLLIKMGYKGTEGGALVTQKSNDGGIDGILNQDALGFRKVYVQVKRYAEKNTVGRQAISQFHGDLDLQQADNGVFITTSSFTNGAEQAAKRFNIKLIDGDALTKLMIQYKVGVQVKNTYELLEIDDDFFDQD
ncbi:restriction endonuclease [Lactobacillus helveticus]|uniref:restriction endonuclease n=1 Tax=Lactobacillus helveticus TaxID=1587 RepID=UPI00197B8404|nr:restriction endonuclease [Lactobacillus helveticus]MBN6048713.1 restriction endonuclease [Lactobacillus helveticus]